MRALVSLIVVATATLACGGGAPEEGRIGVHEFGLSRLATDGTSVWSAGKKGFITEWNGSGQVGSLMGITGQPDVTALAADDGELYVGSFFLTHWGVGDLKWNGEITSVAVRGPFTFQSLETDFVAFYENDQPKWESATYKWVYGSAFSPDGSQVAAWTWDGELYRWKTVDGTVLQGDAVDSLKDAGALGGPLFGGAWIDDTQVVVGGGTPKRSGFAAVWDTQARDYDGRLLLPSRVHAVAVGPAGSIALGCDDGQVWIWDREAQRAWPVRSTERWAADLKVETKDFPIGVTYDVVRSPSSIVAMVPYHDGVVVGTASGAVVYLPVFDVDVMTDGRDGPHAVDAGLPPPPDPRAFLEESPASWETHTGSGAGLGFTVRVPRAILQGPSDRGFAAQTADYSTRVSVHGFRGTSLEATLASAKALNSGTPWLDQETPDGHVIGDASGVTRYLQHDGVLLRCFAVHSGSLDAPVKRRLKAICDTLTVP